MNTGMELKGGLGYAMKSYGLMVQWELQSFSFMLPIMIIVQLFMGAGIVIGFGFLIPNLSSGQAFYLSTGAMVINLLLVGLMMVPQIVANRKMANMYDFLWSLPVPRIVGVLATLTVSIMVALPGAIAALVAGTFLYGLELNFSPLIIPAALLTILVSSSIGFAFAHAIKNPMLTLVITQALFFVVLMFSPINYSADQLPGWLAAVHQYLPFEHSAKLVRGTLSGGSSADLLPSFLVLSAWALASWLLTFIVLNKKR